MLSRYTRQHGGHNKLEKEVAMKNWIFKGVLPLLLIAFLLFFFKGAYMVDGKIDWFWLWMCVGAPFGIVHLAVFVIPVNMDITSSLGVLFAYIVISGLLGGFIAVWTAIKAIYFLVVYPIVIIFNFAPN